MISKDKKSKLLGKALEYSQTVLASASSNKGLIYSAEDQAAFIETIYNKLVELESKSE